MGSEDKTPVSGGGQPARRQTPPQPQAPVHHTNPYGLPQWPPQPWLMTPVPPAAEPKKDPAIPEWLKFVVASIGAVLAVSGVLWKGGAIVNRFETLERKFDERAAQQDQRDRQRDEAARLDHNLIIDLAAQQREINAKIGRLNLTRRNHRTDE